MSYILGNGDQLRGMTRTDSVGQVLGVDVSYLGKW